MAVSRTRLESILLDLEADLQPAASVYRPLQADGHAAAEAADLAPWDPIVVDDLIGGTDGDDTLAGTVGDDTLDGGLGADSMAGGAGNDTYVVDNAADIVTELDGEGTDSVLASVSHTLALDVENLTLTGIEAINATGNTAANVLIGNSGANVINGGKGADTMVGGAGNDTYYLDSAADVITELAGEGSDTVKASISYSLGSGLEKLVLTGGGALTGAGNNNNNSLTGNTGNNRLTGNGGNDVLDGGAGVDTLEGGIGNDTYVLDSTTDTVLELAGEGIDLVKASVSVVLAAEVENLTLVEGAAINGTGNTMANTLLGNTLDNVLDGGAGIDTLSGGKGNDSYVVDDAADMVNELADEGTDTVQTSLSWTLGANLENLTLLGSDTLNATGNTLKNLLTGNSAANVLDGGSGADTMAGGAGNDTYLVDNANDVITEVSGQGVDTAQASVSYALGAGVEKLVLTGNAALNGTGNNLANTLTGNSAANQMDGGVGADTLVGGQGNDVYLVDDAADVVTEVAGQGTDEVRASITAVLAAEVERLTLTGTTDLGGTGNSMDNLITGNSGLNTLNGLTGNDTLDGGAGADTLVGGAGDDTYLVDIAADVITEVSGEGNDTVRSSVTYTLGAQVENLVLEGSANVNAVGNGLANSLTGNTGNNTLNGGSGADTMQGGAGNDLYIFESASDQAVELADEGIDTVQASLTTTLGNNLENLTLSGTAALNGKGNSLANSLLGNSAANQLEGLGGNDTLDGGAGGVDTLIGGNGNDTYEIADNTDILTELSGGGIDTVLASFTNSTLGAQLENLT
ncbi:beta strand repeat-containing protein, partial [Ideonella sp.]|uniref:beta strand repeat-containing protein n=1 Tax=Ideonella sp. TaxID=1929293 RepID=UPI003BB67F61